MVAFCTTFSKQKFCLTASNLFLKILSKKNIFQQDFPQKCFLICTKRDLFKKIVILHLFGQLLPLIIKTDRLTRDRMRRRFRNASHLNNGVVRGNWYWQRKADSEISVSENEKIKWMKLAVMYLTTHSNCTQTSLWPVKNSYKIFGERRKRNRNLKKIWESPWRTGFCTWAPFTNFTHSGPLQVELTFKVGDIIHVYGDMDPDGFYTVRKKNHLIVII